MVLIDNGLGRLLRYIICLIHGNKGEVREGKNERDRERQRERRSDAEKQEDIEKMRSLLFY